MPHVFQIRTSKGQQLLDGLKLPDERTFEDVVHLAIGTSWYRKFGVELDPARIYIYEPKISDSMGVDLLVSVHAWHNDLLAKRASEIESDIDRRIRSSCSGTSLSMQVSLTLVGGQA